jgi:hypothetical protein
MRTTFGCLGILVMALGSTAAARTGFETTAQASAMHPEASAQSRQLLLEDQTKGLGNARCRSMPVRFQRSDGKTWVKRVQRCD